MGPFKHKQPLIWEIVGLAMQCIGAPLAPRPYHPLAYISRVPPLCYNVGPKIGHFTALLELPWAQSSPWV